MNKQLLRLKQRSNNDLLQVAESDDSNNMYVNVAAGTLNEVQNVTSVDLVDEVNKAVIYGMDKEHNTTKVVSLTDEGSIWTKNIQDVTTLETSYVMTWPDGAPQFYGGEHVYTLPADYVYDKHYIYVANPSPDTALNLSVRNGVQMFGGQVYGQIYSAVVPAASYTLFSSTAWSSCFTNIGGVLTDESADLNDAASPSGDVPFEFTQVNDAIYFGATLPFQRMRINTGTAGIYDALGIWEYWNGSAWTTVPNVFDTTNATVQDGTQSFKRTGSRYIQWQIPGDWTAYDITGSPTSQYWVRWRITNFTSRATGPGLTQGWYKLVGKANVHGYLVEGLFNGEECKVTLENATAVPVGSGFNAEIYIRSV